MSEPTEEDIFACLYEGLLFGLTHAAVDAGHGSQWICKQRDELVGKLRRTAKLIYQGDHRIALNNNHQTALNKLTMKYLRQRNHARAQLHESKQVLRRIADGVVGNKSMTAEELRRLAEDALINILDGAG